MKSKRLFAVAVTLLATALFVNSASACLISDLFKSHKTSQPTSQAQK